MRNIILASIIAGLVSFVATTGAVKAGWWTKASGMFADTVDSKLFAISAQGFNVRGYVYENPANPGHSCIFNASEGGSGGTSCDWSKD